MVGVTSNKKIRGYAKYLAVESKRQGPDGPVDHYHYRIPKELLGDALKAGGEEAPALPVENNGPSEPESDTTSGGVMGRDST